MQKTIHIRRSLLCMYACLLVLTGMSSCGPNMDINDAVRRNDLPRVMAMVETDGFAFKRRDDRGNSPLHIAAECGYTDILVYLVEAGADPEDINYSRETPLDVANRAPNSSGADLLQVTLLCSSAERGHVEDVIRWLDSGVDPNGDCRYSLRPIHYAVVGKHMDVVELLVDRGADVNVRTKTRQRSPHKGYSCASDYVQLPGLTPLMLAARDNCVDMVRLLVERGAEVDAVDQSGQSALFHAAETNSTDAMRLLLGSGSYVDLRDSLGRTALFNTTGLSSAIDALELLLASGASPNAQDVNGNTPLHQTVYGHALPNAAMLLTQGADPDIRNKAGHTPLSAAVEVNMVNMVRLIEDSKTR